MTLSFHFGTVGSPIGTPKKPGGSVGAIGFSKSIGLTAFELGWVQSVRVSEETCAAIKQTAKDEGVSLSVHAPYFFNLNATDEEWPKSRKRLMDAAHYGNLAGATDIIFHPGSYFERPPAEVLKVSIPRLKSCADELKKKGNPVILRPETMGKSAMLGSLEDTLEMSKAIKNVQPCLDFAHLHARPGDGTMNTVQEWTRLLEAYQAALGKEALKNLHIHLSGIEYGPKGEKNHLALAESDLKINFLFQVLKEFGCAGRILCESPIMEDDALNMKKAWTKISGEKE
ncbi:MAG TPA: TIM barrel protein [Anaerolineales bacterium]|nr:TIM barrel protein [Anaerolineales bacterium]HNQ93077.1 TIM barrel protein [Anaerolineales bacterium]HNS61585.1 TIM barrel protein [Anaerolineales bacterium]